jgi:nucleoside-diphosphate-sugar epimerase
MKILVTGASGYIGNKLAHVLAERGYHVHALVRSSASGHLFHHHNIRVFVGDILDPDSLAIAMKDCRQVYHAAAFAKLWDKDRELFYKINVGGTENVLQAAKKVAVYGVRMKIIFITKMILASVLSTAIMIFLNTLPKNWYENIVIKVYLLLS